MGETPASFSSTPLKFYILKVLTVDIFRENLIFFVVQVRIMRKRLVRKTFDMIEEIAEKEDKEVQPDL